MNEIPPTNPIEQAKNVAELPPPATASNPAVEPNSTQHLASASYPEKMATQDSLQKPLTMAVAVLAVMLAAQWWSSNTEIRSLREEMAKRLQNNDTTVSDARMMAKGAQDGAKELHAKYSILENKQAEAQSQQLALEQLYQELSRNRDDWALAEIEQVLSTADQQLQLAGNVQGALIALQNADRTLSRSDKTQFIQIRRAIAKDMERLKALPNLDLPGIAVRLDSVISQIDKLPLLSDEKPAQALVPPKKSSHSPKLAAKAHANKPGEMPEEPSWWTGWSATLAERWQSLSSEIWLDVRQLIRVRSVEKPIALMMTPEQAYFTRENLKLRLLNARLGLLSRNESAFRSDLLAAQDTIAKFFDGSARQTQNVQLLLKAAQGSNLSIEMPSLGESLNAVRNYKAKPGISG